MQLKDISFETPQENICYDEVLLRLADKHAQGEFLRFWESPKPFIVLGRIGKADEDVWLDRAKQDLFPVLRRSSGGGTVIQGKGCLNYTLVLSKERHADLADLRKSYFWISAKVIEALKVCAIEAVFRPISDIALANSEKKISGNAQHRGKNSILHHGTILYDFDLTLISRYLKMPRDIPEYRKNRPHEDFVSNAHLSAKQFKEALAGIFGLKYDSQLQDASPQELLALEELLQKRLTAVDS